MAADLLLTGARIVRRDGTLEGPASVLVSSGRIASISSGDGIEVGSGVSRLDCSGCYISPGLVNLHTHSPMTILRGLAEDVSIDDWFNVRVFPYESSLTPEDVRSGAVLAVYEMIDSGVTAFFDHYFMTGEIVSACKEAGIRADIAPTVFGSGDWKAALQESVEFVERLNGEGGLVRARFGPHAPYTCPPEVLEACGNAAARAGVGLHIHVSETARQVEESLSRYGRTPFRVAYDAGLMDSECIFAHGTFMREEDLQLITTRSFLAIAPKTYLKLASGASNVYEVLRFMNYPREGSPLIAGIGTDGAASSATQSPLEQARLFALLGKDRMSDAAAFDLRTVWRTLMAGHDALHQGSGDVAPGYAADLTVWDLRKPPTWPVTGEDDPEAVLAAILYSSDSRSVRDVLVAGRLLKRGGRVVSLDAEDVFARAEASRRRLLSVGTGRARVRY